MKLEFSGHIFENYSYISNCMKIRPVRAELLHAEGRAGRRSGMMKLVVALLNFANAPENCKRIFCFSLLHPVPHTVHGMVLK